MNFRTTFSAIAMVCAGNLASAQDWTGFYAGGSLAFADMTSFKTDGNSAPGRLVSDNGFGLFGGYNHQLASGLVLGAELNFSSAASFYDVVLVPTTLAMTNVIEARGRIGYAAGDIMPYAMVGFVSGRSDFDDTMNQRSARENGRMIGLGIEYRTTERMSVRLEYETQTFRNLKNAACGTHQDCDTDISVISLGVAWHF
jgi:outer membrane immunogenic protein